MIRVVSVSGGKDSTALYLWAIERWGRDFRAVFADTGHEHPVTYNYVRNLPEMAGGPEIDWVRADFRELLRRKFTEGIEKRSPGQVRFIERNLQWMESQGFSSGNPYLDMIMFKGRVPASRSQFCTEYLKLAPIRDWINSIRGDHEIENYIGIRAEESQARAKMPESDWNPFMDCQVFRPLLRWTSAQVFDLLRRHGVPPNPLYEAGFSRVGCFPCIHARKSELARLPDWAWEKLSEWERIIGRSWFPPGTVPLDDADKAALNKIKRWRKGPKRDAAYVAIVVPTTEKVRQWSKTTRGGRQLDLWAPDAADVPSCMSTWGHCE